MKSNAETLAVERPPPRGEKENLFMALRNEHNELKKKRRRGGAKKEKCFVTTAKLFNLNFAIHMVVGMWWK